MSLKILENLSSKIKNTDDETKSFIKELTIAGVKIASIVAAEKIYDSFFKRYERPDYSYYPGLYDYEKIKDKLPRELITFPSGKVELQGYYYKVNKPKGLIVFVHGFHAGADDYLPAISYLVEQGFNVFSYDGTGTFSSGGDSCVGMCQTLLDLDACLNFIEKRRDMRGLPLFLIGHSCGGYAVSSILSIHKNVKAVACIAAVYNCYTLMLEKGNQYAGELATQGMPKEFLNGYQKALFGKYVNYNGVDGINSTKIPVLIAHGLNDETIAFDLQSLISHRDEITNPNVQYYFGTDYQGGHVTIWHSERSAKYQKEVDEAFKKINKKDIDAKRELNKKVDHYLYSEINYDLFEKIVQMFEKETRAKKFSFFKK